MSKWKESDLEFLLDKKYFPDCVECGGHFFHSAQCSRVSGHMSVSMDVINERLDARLEEFNSKHRKPSGAISCAEPGCMNDAAGKMHVLYHGTQLTAEEWAVCMDHAFHEDILGRECQFRGFKND